MSRGYRITWVTVTGQVSARDTLTVPLSLLGILPAGDMVALLRDELQRDGWTPDPSQPDALAREVAPGLVARLAPDGGAVTVTARDTRDVSAQGMDRDAATRALSSSEGATREALTAELGRRLVAVEPDLRVGAALQRVYLEALRRKAASLGQVESVQEHTGPDGQVEVTIKVRT
jgi:DnaJ-domain-containing protein 1